MMTDHEIIAFWGRENLRVVPASVLDTVAIPASAKWFLRDVGLPAVAQDAVMFDEEGSRLPRLAPGSGLRRIAHQYKEPICLNEEAQGTVIVVGSQGIEFINSGVEQFMECLTHFRRYRNAIGKVSSEQLAVVIADLDRTLREIDPHAFLIDDPRSWWPGVMVAIEEGFL